MDKGRIAAEGLDGPHVARIFGIEKVDGRWQPGRLRSGVRRRVRDHRGEIGLGGELVADKGLAGELPDRPAPLDQIAFEAEQHAGLDRRAELRILDRHEIDELARMPARPRLSTASTPAAWASASMIITPGMIGRPGKWPWKKSSFIVTAFMATIRWSSTISSTRSTRSIG